MTTKRSTTVCLILAALFLCANSALASRYGRAVDEWTKSSRSFSFDTLDARLIWHATMLSDRMIDAQKRLSEKRKVEYKYPPIKGIGFFVSMYTYKTLKSFNMEDSSTWKIYLVGQDGTEIEPVKIEPVTITPTESVFYPYLNRWSKAYYVTFPSIDLGPDPKLILRSIVAESVLKWKL